MSDCTEKGKVSEIIIPSRQSYLGQLRLLLWKNLILRRRHWLLTLLELVIPVGLMCLIVLLRTIKGSVLLPVEHDEVSVFKPGSEFQLRRSFCEEKSFGLWIFDECNYNDKLLPGDRKLFWGPRSPFTEKMIDIVKKEIFFKDSYLHNVSSIEMMDNLVDESYMLSNDSFLSFYVGIYFNLDDLETDEPPLHLNYDLRLQKFWFTELIYPLIQFPGPRNKSVSFVGSYNMDGFTLMQTIIDRAYMKIISEDEEVVDNIKLETQMYPYPPYIQDHGLSQLYSGILPTLVVFSLVLLSPTLIKSIVYEKETGVRELIRMMGLEGWLTWVGWFLYSFSTIFLVCMIITGMLKVQVTSNDGTGVILPPLLIYSDPSLLFFILILYGISAICFCFVISCFFSKPILATTIGVLLWLLSYYIPRTILATSYNDITLGVKLLICVIPNMAMMLLFKIIGLMEGRAVGMHWNNLWETGNPKDDLAPAMILIMMAVDIVLFIFITWYVDQVIPGKYGVARPWYFMFQSEVAGTTSEVPNIYSSDDKSPYTEAEPEGLSVGIKIRGLRKVFRTFNGKVKVAVENVDLTCYKGQCTVLLGHNGAGKTTTMSVITGVFAPTGGYAEVNGWDIKNHLKEARSQIGLCPQHNTLFADLTVRQHLLFFARLKGLTIEAAKRETKSLLHRLQLEDKKDQFGGELSGGMKRKLCLAIALIGGSKIIILDEPSSGLDPESRRWVWDVVQQERGERTVLVTTHHMEEADVLGDRVAIMANGRVVCCGSSIFLKNAFGDGYTLSITGQEETDITKVEEVIFNHFEDASLRSADGFYYDFKLPLETIKFPKLLDQLSREKAELKINHLGLSLTTMEQVFLNVGELEDFRMKGGSNGILPKNGIFNESFGLNLNDASNDIPTLSQEVKNWDFSDVSTDISSGTYREYKLSGKHLWFQRFQSLWIKKFIYSKRKWLLMITQALIPVAVTLMSLLVDSFISKQDVKEASLELNINMFEYSFSSVEYHDNVTEISQNYIELFYRPYEVDVTDNISYTLLYASEEDINVYRENYITSALFKEDSTGMLVTRVMYQSIPYHATGVGVNFINNAVLHTFVDKNHTITTNNAPLPLNKAWKMDDDQTSYSSSLYSMVMPLALAFLTSSFLVFPLQERVSKSKQIQLMTGTSSGLLWCVSYVWDLMLYMVSALLIFICFMFLDTKENFTVDGAPGALLLLLVLYGIGSIPMSYVFSFPFHSAASGFAVLALTNIVAGMIISTATLILDMTESDKLIWIADIIGNITAFIPSYPASKGFLSIVDVSNYNRYCEVVDASVRDDLCHNLNMFVKDSSYLVCCPEYCENYGECFKNISYFQWQYPGLGMHLMYLVVDFFFYLIILYMLEIGLGKLAVVQIWKLIRRIFPVPLKEFNGAIDADVQREKLIANDLMHEENVEETAIIVQNLTKIFEKPGIVAVREISFHVKTGECFGLLGVNGAGKTTTFRMLTGDEIRSAGDARIGNNFLSHGRRQFMEEIGYCPQFDAVIGELTGEETLSLMAGLRGVAKRRQPELLQRLIALIDLTECAKRPSSTYSGGNKRKLSTAMALVGQPPLVFLDEPTSGVDPASRRRVWEAVRDATRCGQSVILTSHSMDECEALCSNIAIMAKGVMRCIGTPKHLKAKFGRGYTLQIKIKSTLPRELCQASEEENEANYKKIQAGLKTIISSCFSGSKLTDEHRGMLVYRVPSTISWSKLFTVMEALKTGRKLPEGAYEPLWRMKVQSTLYELLIEDYAAMDPSLEQVFLSFARENDKIPSEILSMETTKL